MFFIELISRSSLAVARYLLLGLVAVLAGCSSSSDDVSFSSLPGTLFIFDYPAIGGIATTGDGTGFTNYGRAYWFKASDEVEALDVLVNDGEVTTLLPAGENPYAWQYILGADFVPGLNTYSVVANVDDTQLVNELTVSRGTSWMHEVAIQFDANASRWLLLDKARRALLSIDLSNGKKTVLSDVNNGSGIEFNEPVDFVVDSVSNRALLVDRKLAAVIAVALADDIAGCDVNVIGTCVGDRQVISDVSTPDMNNPFNEPVAIEFGVVNEFGVYQNAYIADRGHRDIIEMNLADGFEGERVFIPAASNAEPAEINIPLDVAFHASSNRLFVTDRILQNVISIDLDTDERTVFDDTNDDPDTLPIVFGTVSRLLVHEDTLYVTDTTPGVIAIDLDQDDSDPDRLDGERAVLSDNFTPNFVNIMVYPGALAIDSADPEKLLVIDNLWGVITTVELTNIDNNGIGHRNYIPGGAVRGDSVINCESLDTCEADGVQTFGASGREAPGLSAVLQDPRGFIFYQGSAATIDRSTNRIVSIDLASGARNPIVQLEDDTEFIDPRTLASDGANLYIVDVATDQVTRVNRGGSRSRIPAFAPAFAEPVDAILAGDPEQETFVFDTLYVLDKALNDVVTINLLDADEDGIADGERDVLGLSCLVDPIAIEWHPYPDEGVNELLILDRGANKLLSVDLSLPGAICSEVASLPAGVEAVDMSLDIRAEDTGSYDPDLFDAGDWSVLILDAASSELFPIGIGGDNRAVIGSAYSALNNMNDPFVSPIGLIFNAQAQRAYVLDQAILSLYAVDLTWRDALSHFPLQVEDVESNVNATVDAQRIIFSRGTSLNCDVDDATPPLDPAACDIPEPEDE